ncbi:hypothetical protein PIROE2DRAFT_2481 [Piromyces sp. E2]|nr:hypothetical protein PIROE2DRAFT_2481 [Piromyces sp. E2]|eukprot:OUM69613.1 hypothetical protein PIROE2DRAFT_2481 [Piromyces sp. E2]
MNKRFETSNAKTYRPYITIILWITALLFTIMYTEIISCPWFQHGATAFLIGIIVYRSLYIVHGLSNSIKSNGKDNNSIDYHLLTTKPNSLKKTIAIQKHIRLLKFLLAWWHFFTGIGTYCYFIFSQYLRNIICNCESTHIEWLFHLIPYVSPNGKHIL